MTSLPAAARTRRPTLPALLVVGLLVSGVAPAAAQTARRLTFTQAMEAATRGREIQIAEQGVAATEARVSAATSQRGPALRAEANIQYWDSPLKISFAPMPTTPPTTPTAETPALVVREQVTSQITLTLAQPISGLFVLHRLVGLERHGAQAARADHQRARLDTAQRVSEAYLRLLQAKALREVAQKSVTQVEAQLDRAKILERGGALGRVDVLRVSSARDAARQGLMRAQTGVTVATAALALALDLPTTTALEVVDDLPDPPPAVTVTEAEAVRQATEKSPDLAASRERAEQAREGRAVAMAALFPNVLAVAVYQHTEGQSTFQPKNAWFIGATLSWDLWDWGKNWNGVKEAEAKANQAALGPGILRDQTVFDVQRRVLETRTAYETIAVARSSLEAAEEAHRIQSVRYAGGAATTTDVLDAEVEVTRARSGYAQARYDYYLAQAGLARALGQIPSTQAAR